MLLAHKNLNESDVEIIGPVQFDFYYNNKFSVNKEDWLSNELLRNKKVILYSGGPSLLFNNEIEYLEYIDEAINNGDLKKFNNFIACTSYGSNWQVEKNC